MASQQRASINWLETSLLDALLPLQIGPTNGREARESNLSGCGQDAPRAGLPKALAGAIRVSQFLSLQVTFLRFNTIAGKFVECCILTFNMAFRRNIG
jgi:hypothetical protein